MYQLNIFIIFIFLIVIIVFRYIFCGVVSYEFDHYVAVIRRVHGNWELHNDLQKKISKSKQADNKVNPHLVVYIKQ